MCSCKGFDWRFGNVIHLVVLIRAIDQCLVLFHVFIRNLEPPGGIVVQWALSSTTVAIPLKIIKKRLEAEIEMTFTGLVILDCNCWKMIDITIMNEWYLTYPSMLVAYSVLKRVCKSFWRPLEIAPNLKSHTNPINTSPTSKNSSIIQYPLRRRLFKRKAPTHPTSYKMK